MKKVFLLSAAIMLGIMLTAQTQQGYVKTKGRMVNGKLVPGQGLKGATVSIKGRIAVLVNQDDGAFSFPIPKRSSVSSSLPTSVLSSKPTKNARPSKKRR